MKKYDIATKKIKDVFIAQYRRISPNSAKEYNAKRERGVPGWATTAKLLGVKKWSELLEICELREKSRQKTVKTVLSIVDLEEKLKNLD